MTKEFLNNIVKIKYINEGYLPNLPYHLITDAEMVNAFISDGGYFDTEYSIPSSKSEGELVDAYDSLKSAINYHLSEMLNSGITLPDWVYSYMFGAAICNASSEADKHDMFVLLGLDNPNDDYTEEIAESVYRISKKWLLRLPATEREHRPPTMFGEPHVIKYLRLMEVEAV